MLERNIIRPSVSRGCRSLCSFVKDGSVHLCVDYRALKKVTRKDVYPVPQIYDALDCLQGALYVSNIDLKPGYWQISMHEFDKENAFSTSDALYELNVLPLGL